MVSSCGCIASGCCLEELNVQKSIGPKTFITIGPQTMSYFLIAIKYPKLFIFLLYLLLLFEQVTAKSNTVAIYPNKLLNINQLYSHLNFHWQKIFQVNFINNYFGEIKLPSYNTHKSISLRQLLSYTNLQTMLMMHISTQQKNGSRFLIHLNGYELYYM